jgi:hypothetical protein
MTIEQTLTIPKETRHLTVDLPEPVPAGTATFRLEWADGQMEEQERLEQSRLRDVKKYPSLAAMRGCCKGLDTMDEYFARKQAEKERERQQERRYEEEME